MVAKIHYNRRARFVSRSRLHQQPHITAFRPSLRCPEAIRKGTHIKSASSRYFYSLGPGRTGIVFIVLFFSLVFPKFLGSSFIVAHLGNAYKRDAPDTRRPPTSIS
ncbi:hypothetical protein BJY01DRAFT_97188 [Aspergillus pseudoustus]|uniref:Uncharacterized protein n=1 Tax=Aspergillus pseudoustus TaxID=1810923 RepID=A0ABR4IZB2_9EURO